VSKKDLDDATAPNCRPRRPSRARRHSWRGAFEPGFTRITSPVAGIAGIAKAQIGNLVGPDRSRMTRRLDGRPDQGVLLDQRAGVHGFPEGNGYAGGGEPEGGPPLEMILAGGTVYPHKGRIPCGPAGDVKTGTLRLGASFQPGTSAPRPVRLIRATMATKKGALLVPQRA